MTYCDTIQNLEMLCTMTHEKWKLVDLFITISLLRAKGLFTNKIVLISFTLQLMVYGSSSMFDKTFKPIKKVSANVCLMEK